LTHFATPADVVRLGQLVLRFGRVNRATFHEDGARPETDTDHTVMLGIIACALASDGVTAERTNGANIHNVFTRLNPSRVAEFALVHDLVEAYAGDTQSFGFAGGGADAQKAKAAKAERELKAFQRICAEFVMFPWLERTMARYEEQKEPEARFVRYLDKALPKITHYLNSAKTLRNMGKTRDEVIVEHDKQMAKLREEYPEFPGVDDLLRALCRMADAKL
jgi:5'-deoxynucleotidase YfbR-like HD superfamily hydrolase